MLSFVLLSLRLYLRTIVYIAKFQTRQVSDHTIHYIYLSKRNVPNTCTDNIHYRYIKIKTENVANIIKRALFIEFEELIKYQEYDACLNQIIVGKDKSLKIDTD